MRALGINKQWQNWRWAPCAALIGGAVSFIAFAVLAIPERIGGQGAPSSRSVLGATLARVAGGDSTPAAFTDSASADTERVGKSTPEPLHVVHQPASGDAASFPKRGFTPPLDRPDPPPAPEPAPVQIVQQPAVEVAPPPPPPVQAPDAPFVPDPAPRDSSPANAGSAAPAPDSAAVPVRD